MRGRSWLLGVLLAACAAASAGLPRWGGEGAARVGAELVAARRARELVEEKLSAREDETRARVRALYKLSRAGLAPLWVDDEAGRRLVQTRGVARRLILRDLAERAALRDEVARLGADERRLQAALDLAALADAAPLPPRSLRRPVRGEILQGFGERRDERTRARLPGRGLVIAAHPGADVVAPLAGRVVHAAALGALGETVVVAAPDGTVAVLGGLGRLRAEVGGEVAAGEVLGVARARVSVEIRRGGRPVDPAPLLTR